MINIPIPTEKIYFFALNPSKKYSENNNIIRMQNTMNKIKKHLHNIRIESVVKLARAKPEQAAWRLLMLVMYRVVTRFTMEDEAIW